MTMLGLVNSILSGVIVGVPVLIMVGLLFGGIFSLAGNKTLGFGLLGLAGVLFVIFIFSYILVSGILTAFKATVWTIAYNKIKGKYES